jgi:hypothetical protein
MVEMGHVSLLAEVLVPVLTAHAAGYQMQVLLRSSWQGPSLLIVSGSMSCILRHEIESSLLLPVEFVSARHATGA